MTKRCMESLTKVASIIEQYQLKATVVIKRPIYFNKSDADEQLAYAMQRQQFLLDRFIFQANRSIFVIMRFIYNII